MGLGSILSKAASSVKSAAKSAVNKVQSVVKSAANKVQSVAPAAKDVAVGAVTGAVTGFVSGGIPGAIGGAVVGGVGGAVGYMQGVGSESSPQEVVQYVEEPFSVAVPTYTATPYTATPVVSGTVTIGNENGSITISKDGKITGGSPASPSESTSWKDSYNAATVHLQQSVPLIFGKKGA